MLRGDGSDALRTPSENERDPRGSLDPPDVGGDGDDPLRRRALERLGTTVHGKYHLDRLLGVGGMACVYAARHRNGERTQNSHYFL